MNPLSPIEQIFARLCFIAFTVQRQMDAQVPATAAAPAAPAQTAPSPVTPPQITPYGDPNVPVTPPQITTYGDPNVPIDATKRIRRTKVQIAADATAAAIGGQPDLTSPAPAAPAPAAPAPAAPAPAAPAPAAPAPAAPAPAAELSPEARKALRLELSEAVRESLTMNGEAETVRRLGYAKISAVPDTELAATTLRMKA